MGKPFVSLQFAFFWVMLAAQPGAFHGAEYDKNTVLVRLERLASPSIELIERRLDLYHLWTLSDGQYVLFAICGDREPTRIAAEAKCLPGVEDAQPNYLYRALWTPNDPSYPYQWGLTKIQWPLAMDLYQGRRDVRVAVVDTGVQHDHTDLWANVGPGWNTLQNNSSTADDNGHGTMVAGIVGAMTNNAIGIAGTAPNVTLVPIKALDRFGQGTSVSVREAILWAVSNGCHVINLSLGTTNYDPAVESACILAWSTGAVLVGAAGNSGSTFPVYPGAFEVVLNVGATTQDDTRWPWSNFNAGPYRYVDIAAPGDWIISTLNDGGLGFDSGTSYAAPFASGVAALLYGLRARNSPNIERSQANASAVRSYIETYADPIGDWVKYGRLNAHSALLRASRATVKGTLTIPGHTNPGSVLVVATLIDGGTPLESRSFYPGPNGEFDLMFTKEGLLDIRFTTPNKPFLARRVRDKSVRIGEVLGGIDVSLPGGDVTRDGVISLEDLSLVLVHFDKSYASLDCDGSGRVDLGDLAMVLLNFASVSDP